MIDELKWAAPDRYDLLKEFARQNRSNPTLAETVLWKQIRDRAIGTKFFRQYIIADYIADFASLQHHLIIEVDGAYHSEAGQVEHDESRTQQLQHLGFKVIRFSNEDVLNNIEFVVENIKQHLHNES